MPDIKVTDKQLVEMGAHFSADTDELYNKANMNPDGNGTFLMWLAGVKKLSPGEITRILRDPSEAKEDFRSFQDSGKELSLKEKETAFAGLKNYSLPKADFTNPGEVKEAMQELKVAKELAGACRKAGIPGGAAKYALLDGLDRKIREAYTFEVERTEGGMLTIKNSEQVVRKRYMLSNIGGTDPVTAYAILDRRGKLYGEGAVPSEEGQSLASTEIFPLVKNSFGKEILDLNQQMKVVDYLSRGENSALGSSLGRKSKELRSFRASKEETEAVTEMLAREPDELDPEELDPDVSEKGDMENRIEEEIDTGSAQMNARVSRERKYSESSESSLDLTGGIKISENDEARDEKIAAAKAKLPEMKQRLPRGYDSYKKLHTGYYAIGEPVKTMRKTLSHVLAAIMLEKEGKPFDPKEIHKMEKRVSRHLCLENISREGLEEILKSPKKVAEFGAKMEKDLYNTPKKNREEYATEMKMLYYCIDWVMDDDPKSVTREYRDFANAVKRASQLDPKTATDRDYMQANLDIMNTSEVYMKGRKSVRKNEFKRDRFNSTLDAMAIIRKYGSGTIDLRIRPTIDRINEVRGTRHLISDPNYVTIGHFGLLHMKRRYNLTKQEFLRQQEDMQKIEQQKKSGGRISGGGETKGSTSKGESEGETREKSIPMVRN